MSHDVIKQHIAAQVATLRENCGYIHYSNDELVRQLISLYIWKTHSYLGQPRILQPPCLSDIPY